LAEGFYENKTTQITGVDLSSRTLSGQALAQFLQFLLQRTPDATRAASIQPHPRRADWWAANESKVKL
jgi:hypothetical protein